MRSYGVPGGGLAGASHMTASRIRQARLGEQAMAKQLERMFESDEDVYLFSNCSVPGLDRGNVDHVVVRGAEVLLVDVKRWKPGFYWTFRGATRRGSSRFPAADKLTLKAAVENYGSVFRSAAAELAEFRRVRVRGINVVVATGAGRYNTWLLSAPAGLPVVMADRCEATIRKALQGDPTPIAALLRTIHGWLIAA